MTIKCFIIQSNKFDPEEALINLQRNAIFLAESYYSIKSMTPFLGKEDERPTDIEFSAAMRICLERMWKRFRDANCPIEVLKVQPKDLPKIEERLLIQYHKSKTNDYPLGFYWLQSEHERVGTTTIYVDKNQHSRTFEYLTSLRR